MSVAEKLVRLRQQANQSLQQVAESVGASRAHIWEIETGRTKNPSLDLARRLANHYKVSVGWLIGEVPDSDTDPRGVALYRSVQSLSPQNRQHIEAIIDSMRKAEK
jgi:transcriptional regulator with XRE-family HTH domain